MREGADLGSSTVVMKIHRPKDFIFFLGTGIGMDELVEKRHMHEIEQLKKLSIRDIPIQYDNMHTQLKKTS